MENSPLSIKKVCVIGAGTMGSGIAAQVSQCGVGSPSPGCRFVRRKATATRLPEGAIDPYQGIGPSTAHETIQR